MKYLSKFENDIVSILKECLDKTDRNWNYITPQELKKDLDTDSSKYFLLDIRKPEDYKKGHIKGAKNIFWMKLLDNLDKLPKDKKIVLICYVGHTASQMLFALKILKYNVIALKFGMGMSPVEGVPVAGWLDYGFPVK